MLKSVGASSRSRVPRSLQEYEGDRQFASTLARGLELLLCFTREDPVLGNKDLSRRLGLPPATVSRLTYTLACMGFLAPTGHHGKYQLGSAVLSLGHPVLSQFDGLRRRARPLMMALAEATGGTLAIGIRDRLSVIYIETVRSHSHRIYPVDIGTRHSLAGTAMGRALLMSCRVQEREALINQLQVKAQGEWAQHGMRMLHNVQHFPELGCCLSLGEVLPDVQAVAVPLGRIDRGEPAALNFSVQGRKIDQDWLLRDIAPRLQALAREFT